MAQTVVVNIRIAEPEVVGARLERSRIFLAAAMACVAGAGAAMESSRQPLCDVFIFKGDLLVRSG